MSFGDLLQAAEQLTADLDPSAASDLPRVERNLHQIVEAGQQLFAKTSRDVGSQDVKAAILLGSRGIDLPSITNKLETISSGFSTVTEPTEPLRDTDVVGFLRNERENALLSVIEETRHDTFESAERQHWEAVSSEWEADKMRILTALSGANASEVSESFVPRKEATKIHETTLGIRSSMDAVEMSYASQIGLFNEMVTQGGLKPNLGENLASLFPEDKDAEVARMWEMVTKMSEISAPPPSNDPAKYRVSPGVNRAIISKAKAYLESAFLKFVQDTVYTNLQQAQLGGVPGTYHLVRSYLNVRISPHTPGLEDGLVDGVPIWPLIYFCIRCGDMTAAVQAAAQAGTGLDEIKKVLSEVASSADKRLNPHAENLVRINYKRTLRSTTDPYKRAVFCVLAACDPYDEHSEVATSLDDYLWIKISQIREKGEGSEATLILSDFQKQMSEDYGETHFNAFERPLLYFQVLFLTGQFELAFEFLFRVDRLRPHGLHMALAMYESGLLLLPNNIQAQLITAVSGSIAKKINIARLLLLYVRKFEDTNAKEALHYFYFLRDMKKSEDDKSTGNLFMSCVSELVLESREFDLLLGQILTDGSRSPGLIDKFQGNSNVDVHRIIELVAEDSESKGMFEDSVRLYDLAKKHDKVIELLNKLLAQVISLPPVPESRRNRLQKQAIEIAKRYRANGFTASEEASFFLLLDLMTFFDLFHSKKADDALQIIAKIKIIPLAQGEIDSMVATFRMLNDEVRRNIPDILLATMNVLYSNYRDSKSSASGRGVNQDGGLRRHLESLRSQAKAIITYAGMIPYRMPGDTNARLVQMEVLMN